MSEFDPRSLEPFWDNWYIDKLIGEGSFGTVYKIYREEFGKRNYSALKIISIPKTAAEEKQVFYDGMDERSATQYFHDIVEDVYKEISIMAELKGKTNIVSYEDHKIIKKENGIGFYIIIRMELLESLNDYLLHHTLTNDLIINLCKDICKALILCQKRNLIHRDIKPANIFVSVDGDFKLGDFGISRHLEGMQDGFSVKGTYLYMAPEVYQGGKYDERVDIYSLGMMLYYFLNNKKGPFTGSSSAPKYSERQESLKRRFSGEKLPKPVNADDNLAEVILKACEFDPENRYSSAEEFLKALEALPVQIKEIPVVESESSINNSYVNKNSNSYINSNVTDGSGNSNPDIIQPASYPFDEATSAESDATVMLEDERTVYLDVEQMQKAPETLVSENKPLKSKPIIAIAAALVILIIVCGVVFSLSSKNEKDKKENNQIADITQKVEPTAGPSGENQQQVTKVPVINEITSTPAEPTPIVTEAPQVTAAPLEISISDSGLDDLSRISDIDLATKLDASINNIKDISILSNSIWMKYLDLEGNQISDLTPVSSMQNLTFLNMKDNKISDITPLSSCLSCKVLILSNNNISDINDLKALTSLTNLQLDGNKKLSDISMLGNLQSLKTLILSGTDVSDISILATLTELTYLDLSDTDITNIVPLYGLKNLTELNLMNTDIPLDQKKQIKNLLPDCNVYY